MTPYIAFAHASAIGAIDYLELFLHEKECIIGSGFVVTMGFRLRSAKGVLFLVNTIRSYKTDDYYFPTAGPMLPPTAEAVLWPSHYR